MCALVFGVRQTQKVTGITLLNAAPILIPLVPLASTKLFSFSAIFAFGSRDQLSSQRVPPSRDAGRTVASTCDRDSRRATATGKTFEAPLRYRGCGCCLAIYRYQRIHSLNGNVRSTGISGHREVLENVQRVLLRPLGRHRGTCTTLRAVTRLWMEMICNRNQYGQISRCGYLVL